MWRVATTGTVRFRTTLDAGRRLVGRRRWYQGMETIPCMGMAIGSWPQKQDSHCTRSDFNTVHDKARKPCGKNVRNWLFDLDSEMVHQLESWS
jgi:hypothetical protein